MESDRLPVATVRGWLCLGWRGGGGGRGGGAVRGLTTGTQSGVGP